MPDYAINVTQRVPTHRLTKADDRRSNPRGVYQFSARDGEHALDQFHREVPIAYLDDFEITVTPLPPG